MGNMEEHLHKSIITLPEASYHSATQETLVLEQCTGHQIHHLKCTPVVAAYLAMSIMATVLLLRQLM